VLTLFFIKTLLEASTAPLGVNFHDEFEVFLCDVVILVECLVLQHRKNFNITCGMLGS